MAKLIDGKKFSQEIKDEVKEQVHQLNAKNIFPKLAVIIVGKDPASQVYVRNKQKACEYTGIKSETYELSQDITESELLSHIDRLNKDSSVSGILVQLPLPKHINEDNIIRSIDYKKDVDCFHPYNVGLLSMGVPSFMPCTPAGIIELLKRSYVEIAGKNCVVIGRSNIVGKPAATLLTKENATVTICHSKTVDLKSICLKADILVVAIGKMKMITDDMVKDGAVVIDVGMHRLESKKLCGDVDFVSVEKKASLITPVPGGVGPMTIAMLMKNCVMAVDLLN